MLGFEMCKESEREADKAIQNNQNIKFSLSEDIAPAEKSNPEFAERAHSFIASEANNGNHANMTMSPSPLDFGKMLMQHGFSPRERILKLQQSFPSLTASQIGAFARGRTPNENTVEKHRKWYHRNKPKKSKDR